ncbi:hypothetical protein AU476_20120 [Cupriavidus sp. UYMSc13B]|nr:hypothetical protein AU476_20120 [Cupriavidus sp. UYMSc13B]
MCLDLVDLSIEQFEVLEQTVDKPAECAGQIVRRILDQNRHTQGDIGNALWHNETVLNQQATDLVGLSGASLYEAWRTRWSERTVCCSMFLIGTNRIVGRVTASQVACASVALFLM